MAKQTKITIILDQPAFGEFTEEVGRDLLGSHHCFGVYSSFDQSRVTFEEIDDTPKLYFPACRDAGQCKGICAMCYDLLDDK